MPHEVAGMANYNKNIFVGTGGAEGINKSHFLGAAYGMEKIMGRADTPVRRVLNYASENFAKDLPIVYVQTVVASTDEEFRPSDRDFLAAVLSANYSKLYFHRHHHHTEGDLENRSR